MSLRSDRLKDNVPLDRLLRDYGYDVYLNGSDQQFKCDLHGSGIETKPSARYYHNTKTWYCFACGKVRDVVSTVMEKEGMEYGDACRMLEKKYNLAVWKEYEENKIEDKPYEMGEEIDWEKRVTNRLKSMTRDKLVELDVVLKFWEVYDIIMVNNRGDVSKWKNLFSKLESIK
jgi:hypothetical protein